MARRRKDSLGGVAVVIVGGIVALVSAVPKEAWIAIGVIVGLALVIWAVSKSSDKDSVDEVETHEPRVQVTVGYSNRRSSPAPGRLKGDPVEPRWIPKGQSIEVAGNRIQGGLLYFGSGLTAPAGDVEPALIEPRLPVSRTAPDVSQRQTDYWPSYSTISDEARATYLKWLMSGRGDPHADVGYVFIYFYGLERRALLDATNDVEAKKDLPLIESEVSRLLGIYRENRSFRGYATSFLEYLATQRAQTTDLTQLYAQGSRGDLSAGMKIGLGRLALSGRPLTADLALKWMHSDPRVSFPKALQRCPDEFRKLFESIYSATHGAGIKLPINRTKLRLVYRPASGGFLGKEFPMLNEELPDLSAVVAPVKKLEAIVEECAKALAPYSRFLNKNPSEAHSLEATLLLPRDLWPDSARSTLEALDRRLGDGLKVTTLGELATSLGGEDALTRDKVRALAHALEEIRIGIEPDVLAGARTPKSEDKIVLFRSDAEDAELRESNVYQAASVSLDLACSVAMADGKPHPNELQLLMKQIDGWAQLSNAQRKRLRARLRMSLDAPPSLATLRSKLDVIPANGKRAIAHLLSTLAHADGTVAPAEVKLLEKIYKALGLDAQAVYSDLHIASSAPAPQAISVDPVRYTQPAKTTPSDGLTLDMARIAALQRETAEVSALLSSVFAEEAAVAPEIKEERDESSSIIEPGPLGLDPEHSLFLRLLMTRASWSRQELADAAADMELMLDGAIERINDAAFEHFDAALLEGDDPVEVVRDVMEQIPA